MQGIFQKENTDKVLKYGIYRHLPTYEKIIRNLVSFYTKKQCYHVKKTMKEMEEALPTSLFFHLSRSYLIQLEAIEKINTQTLWMSNGQCIPIPKGKYRLLSKAFIAHHFKEAM